MNIEIINALKASAKMLEMLFSTNFKKTFFPLKKFKPLSHLFTMNRGNLMCPSYYSRFGDVNSKPTQ